MSETIEQTKTEKRTAEKEAERKSQKQRSKERQESIIARDGKLREIANNYMPKIRALQEEMRREQKQVWDAWREQRSKI